MFAAISPTMGTQPFNDWFTPDTTARHPLGTTVTAVDPFWGAGKFIYVASNAAILKGSVCMWDETFTAALLPSTVTQGFCFGIAMAPIPSGSYGWLQLEGRAVYKTNATVAADGVLAIAAAGILGATATGKQVIGIRNRVSATGTKTLTVTTTLNSSKLVAPAGYDGVFLGMVLSGTGIPASTVAAGLDPDGRTIYMGSAIGTTTDKLATATGSITLTGTYTGYGSGVINNPTCMQIVT
jgi:predicted RecA/RadA family phage recombinase